jgi:anti-anti-sigma factor
MALRSRVDETGKKVVIEVEGTFDFALVHDFRESYVNKQNYNFTIDLRKVDYIDSVGLGILLNMLKYLGQPDQSVKIINALPAVRKVFNICRFDKKFTID